MSEEKKKYLRVTEMLWPFSGLTHVDDVVLENAAARGTRVHKICEGIIDGLGEWDVEPHLEGYIESFKQWWDPEKYRVIYQEKRLFCDDLMISGKFDILINDGGSPIVVDLKTSHSPSKTWLIQGSAYVYLCRKNGIQANSMRFVKLSKNGKAAKIYDYDYDEELFRKTYDVYQYFFAPKRKR